MGIISISAAVIGAINDCFNAGEDEPLGRLCFAAPDSKFKQEWGDCLFGELTPEEEILSDRIVRAWTNFAINGYVSHILNKVRVKSNIITATDTTFVKYTTSK